jgi:radical SAM protein with 4Fe4S-binding SPASM domain
MELRSTESLEKKDLLVAKARYLQIAYSYYMGNLTCPYPPAHLDIETTSKCNLDCIMCPHSRLTREKRNMDLSLFKKMVDEPGLTPNDIWLHMFGEPLLHPEIYEMIKYAKKFGVQVGLSTNATLLDSRNAAEIIASGLDRIIISLDGATKETYERVRGHGDYEHTLANVLSFVEAKKRIDTKPYVIIQIIRMKETEKEIVRFTEAFSHLRVNEICVKDLDTWIGNIESINELRVEKFVPRANRVPCALLWYSLGICADGRVVPCCRDFDAEYALGDVSSDELSSIWNSPRMKMMRKMHVAGDYDEIELCKGCLNWAHVTPMSEARRRLYSLLRRAGSKLTAPDRPVITHFGI